MGSATNNLESVYKNISKNEMFVLRCLLQVPFILYIALSTTDKIVTTHYYQQGNTNNHGAITLVL